MKIFCQECGSKTEFATASLKPKFCSECGNPFNPVAQAAKKKAAPVEDEEEEEDDEEDIQVSKNIRVKIEGVRNWENDSLSIDSLLSTSSDSRKTYRPPISQEKMRHAKTKERTGIIEIRG